MKNYLNSNVLDHLAHFGFYKPNLSIPDALISQCLDFYSTYPQGYSNFGYHHEYTFFNLWSKNIDSDKSKPVLDLVDPHNLYSRNIFTTSKITKVILQALIDADFLSLLADDVPLLVGHEVYLEGTSSHQTYGFHFDPYSPNVFYQHMDELSIYIPFCDMTEETGGRLFVQPSVGLSPFYECRHFSSIQFGKLCAQLLNKKSAYLVDRSEIEFNHFDDDAIAKLNNHIFTLANELKAFYPDISYDMLVPVTVKKGEIFLFNNRYYHWVEPLRHPLVRSSLVLRTSPILNIGLRPPCLFLNNQPCNQYILKKESNFPCKINPAHISSDIMLDIELFS